MDIYIGQDIYCNKRNYTMPITIDIQITQWNLRITDGNKEIKEEVV